MHVAMLIRPARGVIMVRTKVPHSGTRPAEERHSVIPCYRPAAYCNYLNCQWGMVSDETTAPPDVLRVAATGYYGEVSRSEPPPPRFRRCHLGIHLHQPQMDPQLSPSYQRQPIRLQKKEMPGYRGLYPLVWGRPETSLSRYLANTIAILPFCHFAVWPFALLPFSSNLATPRRGAGIDWNRRPVCVTCTSPMSWPWLCLAVCGLGPLGGDPVR